MDNWQTAHGLFAYELASGVLVGLVVSGALSKSAATILISECLGHLSEAFPDLQQELQEIAAKGTGQIEMLSIAAGRQLKEP